MNENVTDVFLNALKKHASESCTSENESKEELAVRILEPFENEIGFLYTRNMHLLVRAVNFYLLNSKECTQVKDDVQSALEVVIQNDNFFKIFADSFCVIRCALSDLFEHLEKSQSQKA